jgi:hypothetical protein
VIYTIMSDEQRRQRPEGTASFQVAAKIAAGFVEELDRMVDTLFSCPASDFGCNAARVNNEV